MDPRRSPLFTSAAAVAALACAIVAVAFAMPARAAAVCSASSAETVTPVVELYTSEGCSSCPPADRWLSSHVPADAPVVALAFHVDYWDRLGWKDRFANPAFTQRQAAQVRRSGARFAYTPQVLLDGADRPDWQGISFAARPRPAATVRIQLALAPPGRVTAVVAPLPGAPAQLAAYWAVTEQDFASAVKAGENQGATLHHDHVVRDYRPVAPWTSTAGQATLQFDLPPDADPGHGRIVNLVVVDTETGRPIQAAKLGC